MPTSYFDQFFIIDPFAPPPAGTVLNENFWEAIDQNDNGFLQRNGNDSINGFDITRVYPGDTITVTMNGVTQTISGTTFYLAGHPPIFTPTDGTNLDQAVFQSSTFVTGAGSFPVGDFGPPCFTAGTLIETDRGLTPVEKIGRGDLVRTLDAGFQRVLWSGHSVLDGRDDNSAVVFKAGAIGNDRPLRVSPQHRILVQGWQAELLLGEPEVLVPAKFLVDGKSVFREAKPQIAYYHLLLGRHHLIQSEGTWTESFFPGHQIMSGDPLMAWEIRQAIGDPALYGDTARPTVGARSGRALVAA